ncbi:InlB B-repeat-containing protein [Anaerofustis stercorihominis]|uniref:InlB B-repeat-containing protein n=1 Tax=Anaerofustis stercorihominis TaxID=214853 RepID=UPI00214ADBD6|nr:InlB B-repeat-containing protein [Anaerofustis stercorihominis]MCR2032409.1 InlB B-repeat-containing protein [Anaerofustis stercorihominis]
MDSKSSVKKLSIKNAIVFLVGLVLIIFCFTLSNVKGADSVNIVYNNGSLENATKSALGSTQASSVSSFKVSGSAVLTGDDFAYMDEKWTNATTIDLSGIKSTNDAMDYSNNTALGLNGTLKIENFKFPKEIKKLNFGSLYGLPIKELELPDTLESVASSSLYNMKKLEKVSYHGDKVTTMNGIFSGCTVNTVDFSNASSLTTLALNSSYIRDFDFSGCTNLNNVNLKLNCIDFSSGKPKAFIDSFSGTIDYSEQQPDLTFEAVQMGPLDMNSSFSGPPELKGKLKDGTDLFDTNSSIPSWIRSSYLTSIRKVTVSYLNPSGGSETTLDTSIGGNHTIVWKIAGSYGTPVYNKEYKQTVEVTIPESMKKDVIYIKDGESGNGDSKDSSAGSIAAGLSLLKTNGTLYLAGDCSIPQGINLPANITIKGVSGINPKLSLNDDLNLTGNLTIDNVSLFSSSERKLISNGNKLTLGKDVTTNSSSKDISIYASSRKALNKDVNIEIAGGKFKEVCGGGLVSGGHGDNTEPNAFVNGNVGIKISDNAEIGSLYGGGSLIGAPGLGDANVGALNVNINIDGGTIENVYGAGNSTANGKADVKDVTINITKGTIGTVYGAGRANAPTLKTSADAQNVTINIKGDANITKAVYGGGYAASSDSAKINKNVKINVSENASVNNIYGAGYSFASDNANATVGNSEINIKGLSASVSNVYGSGNCQGTGYVETKNNIGVKNNVNINFDNASLSSVSISANSDISGLIGGDGIITLKNEGKSNSLMNAGTIRYFDDLILDNSHIAFPSNISPNLLRDKNNDNANLQLNNSSSIKFNKAIDDSDFEFGTVSSKGIASSMVFDNSLLLNTLPFILNGSIKAENPINIKFEGNNKPKNGDIIFVSDLPKLGFEAKNFAPESPYALLKEDKTLKLALGYDIKCKETEHGTIKTDMDFAAETQMIEIVINADKGYKLKDKSLKYNDNETNKTDEKYSFKMPGEDVEVVGEFEVIEYNINYHLNGGVNSLNNPNTYNIESENMILADATKNGYTFLGWYTSNKGGSKITQIKTGTVGDLELYARWKKIKSSSGSGSVSDKNNNANKDKNGSSETNKTNVNNPNTNDVSNINLYIVISIISILSIFFIIRKNKLNNNK